MSTYISSYFRENHLFNKIEISLGLNQYHRYKY